MGSMLVVTTAGAGYVMGSGLAIDYYGLSWTCLGTFCVAAAANTINQVFATGQVYNLVWQNENMFVGGFTKLIDGCLVHRTLLMHASSGGH